MSMTHLKEALIDEMKDLYSAEKQLAEVLPKMAEKATDATLKAGFKTHLTETQTQITRLEQAFGLLGEKPEAVTCEAMKGILKESKHLMSESASSAVKDAMLIAAAQKVEHYEITTYGTICTWAETVGAHDVKELLGQSLNEEELANKKLSELAEKTINLKAV